jgi:putative addiction module killer protein
MVLLNRAEDLLFAAPIFTHFPIQAYNGIRLAYSCEMQVLRTREFAHWLLNLKDKLGQSRILARLTRLAEGNPGKTRGVGAGVMELKIDFGPGYRVYFVQRGSTMIFLLCGGDKSTQSKDIERAKTLAIQPVEMEDEDGS